MGAARRFAERLQSLGGVRGEVVMLDDYRIGACRGCGACFDRGESRCPLEDDRDALIEKIMASDGVAFASPNYTLQVSGVMKVFLDRLGFLCHRPRFHSRLFQPAFPASSLLALIAFRMARTSYRLMLSEQMRNHEYCREGGWFESDYYYPTHLGPFKKAVAAIIDRAMAGMRPREAASPRGECTAS